MSILLDIADDIEKKYGTSDVIYREIGEVTEKNRDSKFYGILSKDGLRVIDLAIEDEVQEFHNKLGLVLETSANKVILQGGEFSKKNMSISPLAINFNSETVVKTFGNDYWKEFLIGVSKATFEKMKAEVKDRDYMDELEQLEAICSDYMSSNVDKLAEVMKAYDKNASVRLLYDVDIKHYENANRHYFYNMKKMFSSIKDVVGVNGVDYGYSSYVNKNAKKPCLLAGIMSNIDEVARINRVRSTRNVKDLGYIQHVIKGKDDIYYWEYDSKETPEVIRKNAYIGKSRKYGIGEAAAWQFKSWFENEHGERKRWLMGILRLDIREPKAFRVIKREIMDRVIKALITSDDRANVISSLNNILSFQEWHNEKYGGVELMEMIKVLQEKQDWNDYEIGSLEEYSYMLGQVVYYVNSNSIEAKNKGTLRYAYKYLDTKNVGEKLTKDMKRYQKYIGRTIKFSAVIAALMKSEFGKVDKAMFLAGVMDSNVFYKKKETEETIENTNTIEGEI